MSNRVRFLSEPYWNGMTADSAKQEILGLVAKGARHAAFTRFTDPAINPSGRIIGEMLADHVHDDGGLKFMQFKNHRQQPDRYNSMLAEMIDTSQGQMALLQKVRVDVAYGLADIPLLYGPIFERIAPPGGFPGGVFQIDEYTLQANVVFLQKFEGTEVQFGTLAKGSPAAGLIQTYGAGIEWTEDMIEFDRTWSIELNNRAFGRAYNALLNHLHLGIIIGYDFTGLTANLTPAVTTGSTLQENTHLTLQNAYKATVNAVPRRTGTVILANEGDRFQIEEALLTPVRDAQGNALANVPITTIIYYNGEDLTVGSKVYAYPGVTAGTCFMVMPQRRFKEMVHHDLRVDMGPQDISRLIEGQQVGRSRRGAYADVVNSVQKITLPTS